MISLNYKFIRLILALIGLVIAIIGWYFDRALAFPSLLKLIAPDYISVKQAFDILDSGEKAIIPINHPGSRILMNWWKPKPKEQDIAKISGIGRSTGIFNIITGKHRYELRLLTQENKTMPAGYIWNDVEAKKLMQDILDKSVLKWSGWMFWGGLMLSAILIIWEYKTKSI